MSQTSDEEVLDFPKSIVEHLAPRANEYIADFLHHVVEPIFKGALSSQGLPSDFKFEKIDLGSVVPTFNLVDSSTKNKSETESSIECDYDFEYDGNCDIKISLLGIMSGIKDLVIRGRGRVVLKPLMKKALPFFVGGAQITILDVPFIHFDMEGLAEVCDWPLVRSKIRRELHEEIRKSIVYPNKYCFPLSTGVDPMAYKAFAPIGVISVKLNFAEGLPTKGGIIRSLMGQDKPDTYVKIILGAKELTSKVVKDTTEPSWEDDAVWYEFIVETLNGHQVRVELYDEDTLTKDEFLGEMYIKLKDEMDTLGDIVINKDLLPNELKRTKYEIQGKFTLTLRWLPFRTGEGLKYYGPTRAVLSIFVYSCNNLVLQDNPEGWASAYVEVEYNGEQRKTPVMKKTPHPNYNFDAQFLCVPEYLTQTAHVRVKDESGFDFGTLDLSIAQYHDHPIRRKILILQPESPFATVTLSVYVHCI